MTESSETASGGGIARAVLRAEIEDLVIENAYLLDRGRFRELLELYTEDCEITRALPPFTTVQYETIRGRAALAAWQDGPAWPPTPRTMRHALSNLRVERLADDRAAATVVWTGYRHEGEGISLASPMAVGDYEDEYRRDAGGRWRIHRRKIAIAFLNQQLVEAATMSEKFELASVQWFHELFRLFREVAAQHPQVTFSVCEVFTGVPPRLNPDREGKIAWYGFVRGGEADLRMGEVAAEVVDVKTIADWESTIPFARYKINLADPQDFVRYMAMADKAAAEGKTQRFGDRTKVPPVFIGIHNALAERTA